MAELDRLRTAYREVEPAGTNHLSKEQWERLACDEMDPAEKEVALEHVLSCAECSQVYHGILALRAEAHSFDPGAPPPRSTVREKHRSRWWGILSGLAAAAAVIAIVLLVRPNTRPVPAGRTGSTSVTLRAGGAPDRPVLVSPLGVLPGIPGELSWRPVEEAQAYVVELLDNEGKLLWKSGELTATSTSWPASVKAFPGHYYWRVLAIPEGGGKPVASNLESFDMGVTANRPEPGTPPS